MSDLSSQWCQVCNAFVPYDSYAIHPPEHHGALERIAALEAEVKELVPPCTLGEWFEMKERAEKAEAQLAAVTGERDAYRSVIAAVIAGCDLPANATGDVTDTGDCSKCPAEQPCFESMTLARYREKEAE
jgi:hypothetical protein